MSIRHRKWTWKGKEKSAWIVDYFDAKGTRRLKTFPTKRAAQDWAAGTRIDLKHGTHVADSDSITIEAAGRLWLSACRVRDGDEKLERSTIEQYRQHLELHIAPLIGATRLNKLSLPAVRAFADRLRENGRSAALTRKLLTSLGSIVADAQEQGLTARNPVRERKRRSKATARHKKRLAIGVDIPTLKEVRVLLETSTGRWRAFVATAALAGLRLSELRGLAWPDVDLAKAEITVRQRADAWSALGSPKAAASRRTIPVPQLVVNALREWKLACPKGELGLVFPNHRGGVESHGNAIPDAWHALQAAVGLIAPKQAMKAKYPGLHALRHFYASWCAARPQDGGLGLPLKTVQARMGHSTLAMTADTYGHLFPSQDDADVLAAGEAALMRA